MKKKLLLFAFVISCFFVNAQCPDLVGAMANACGASEGNNEFVVFNTTTTATASTYRLFYGTTNPPTTNALAGSDATTKTGTGTVTGAGCTVVEVTSPATSIPASSKVIFLPAGFDQAYDVTTICGSGTIYVVYIKTNANGGSNSNWTATGTIANTPASARFLQATYSGSVSCNGTNAAVKSYTNSWASNTDGNFVTWNGTTPTYTNYGCTNIVLPIILKDFSVKQISNNNVFTWKTTAESNFPKFQIEKSVDAINYTLVKEILSSGNSVSEKIYNFTSLNNETNLTYYRLKIFDNNGTYVYSKVVPVNPLSDNTILSIYPTVASSKITAQFFSKKAQPVTVQVIDAIGLTSKQQMVITNSGTNNLPIAINTLANGVYRLRIVGDNINYIASFIKN